MVLACIQPHPALRRPLMHLSICIIQCKDPLQLPIPLMCPITSNLHHLGGSKGLLWVLHSTSRTLLIMETM